MIFNTHKWYNAHMTIKKPMKKESAASEETPVVPATGSATIADRFKLDISNQPVQKASAGVGDTIACIVALIALAVTGLLTFTLYQHWEYLLSA